MKTNEIIGMVLAIAAAIGFVIWLGVFTGVTKLTMAWLGMVAVLMFTCYLGEKSNIDESQEFEG